MKNLKLHPWMILVLATGLIQAHGQQAFQNLDFESPDLPLEPFNQDWLAATNAIPGWTPYIGNVIQNQIVYDTLSLGSACISFHDFKSSDKPVEGNYSVIMQSASGGVSQSVGLAQCGTIPVGARSLQFYGAGSIEVTFSGSLIPLVYFQTGTGPYPILAGDITPFAGQYGELRFNISQDFATTVLDNIQFSSEAVPEPSTLVLLGLGGFALIWTRKGSRT